MSTTTHLMTAEELGNLPDEPFRHELIKGELLTMPLPQLEHMRGSANLTIILGQYVKANRLGKVYAEGGYKLESDPDTVLGPDVSFFSQDRIRLSPEGYFEGPPRRVQRSLRRELTWTATVPPESSTAAWVD